MNGNARAAIAGTALSAGAFLLYLALAARDVMFGDGPELTAAAIQNGFAHPPGYPLWVVLGHIASLVPVGPLPFRLNVTACVYHALAVGFVFGSGYVLTRRIGPALFAALLLAIGSPLFVSWSLQAEVFSLNDCFAAAIVLLSLAWIAEPHRWNLVVPLAALFGFGLANHQTLVALLPLPLWAAWCARGAIPPRNRALATFGLAAAVAVLGFALPYAYEFSTSQHLLGWRLGEARTFRELIDLIDRKAYGSVNLTAGGRRGSSITRLIAVLGSGGWPYAGAALGLLGLALRRRIRELVAAGLIVAVPLLAFCAVANIDVTTNIMWRGVFERFGLLPLVALAPFSACAVYVLASLVRQRPLRTAVAAAAFAALLVFGGLRLPALSLAGVHDARSLFADISRALPPRAILMTDGDASSAAALYFPVVERWRPDVTVIPDGLLHRAAYRESLRRFISVPPSVTSRDVDSRDALVRANATRRFFVAGERPVHWVGPRYFPRVEGIVSELVPNGAHFDLARHYRDEAALESQSGYAAITADKWRSNGFANDVRECYALGFYVTAADADLLGDEAPARAWYERARAYGSVTYVGDITKMERNRR